MYNYDLLLHADSSVYSLKLVFTVQTREDQAIGCLPRETMTECPSVYARRAEGRVVNLALEKKIVGGRRLHSKGASVVRHGTPKL